MKYTKPAFTFDEQAERLLKRGLQADRNQLVLRLQSISYYRLSGYLYPFRNPDDTYKSGTTLDLICRRYTFDRQLRLNVLDAVERIEVALRANLVSIYAKQYGPFGYFDPQNLPNLTLEKHTGLIRKISEEYFKSKETFVLHFLKKYGDHHQLPPIWMTSELMSFGTLLTFFRGLPKPMKQSLASRFNIADDVFESWLTAINGVRNICAHHARLWNRTLGYKPLIPRGSKNIQWHIPTEISNDRIFGTLTVLKFCLNQVAPQSAWPNRFKQLLLTYPEIPKPSMGIPSNWEECPIWKQ
jgi:abortive infection bacteriophage resistance protein